MTHTKQSPEFPAWFIVARSGPLECDEARAIYEVIEAQGLVDLILYEAASPGDPTPQYMAWLVCADLSRRSAAFGLSVEGFPHYR